MSKPDDRVTPPERAPDGTEMLPIGPDPTAGWGPGPQQERGYRSPDQPTEQFPGPQYTSDPHQAYGEAPNATQAFPAYPYYDPNQPPPNATQAYPTYYDPNQPPPNQPPPNGPGDGGVPPAADGERKGPGKVVLVAAVAVAALLLTAVVGFGAMLVTSGGADNSTASGPLTQTQLPTQTRPSTPPPATQSPDRTPPDLSRIPGGLGEAIGAAGAAVGTVTTNDGSTLILDGIGGSTVTVTTTPATRVISLNGTNVADLRVGDTVLVQGDKSADGGVTARLIVNTAIPNLGNLGNGGGR